MTEDLNELLTRRADRARLPGDPEQVIALVAARGELHKRTRRNRLAVASGAAVLVAAATVTLAIADGGAPTRPAPEQAGGPPPATTSATGRATVLPVISPLHGSATGHGLQVKNAERAAARREQRRLQREAARRARTDAPNSTTLVHIDPAPADAEISLGLVPDGYVYIGNDGPTSYYGLPGTSKSDCFADGIVADVHLSVGDMHYSITIDGKPASYTMYQDHGRQDGSGVRIEYSDTVDVGFQSPPSAPLTEAQAEQIASTIDVRSTKETTEG